MRVLLLSDRIPPTTGGAGKIVWSLAGGLRDRGHEVHVVTATQAGSGAETRAGIVVHSIHAQVPDRWRAYLSLYNPSAVKAFGEVLHRVGPDVVHAHNIHVDLSYGCLTAAHRCGIPVVFTAHDVMAIAYEKLRHYVSPSTCPPPSPELYKLPLLHNLRQARFRYNPFRNACIRRTLRRDVRLRVAVSEALRSALEANGLPDFRVVHNGVSAEEWRGSSREAAELRTRFGLENRQVVLVAGRVGAAKGSTEMLAALARVIPRVPSAHLLVLSDRPLPVDSVDGDVSQHIRFGGWLSGTELAAAFALSEVVVVPSVCLDALPTVILEAMATAKPVIATCHGGAPDVVQDGVTGFIVNPFDTPRFAGRLIEVLVDKGLQARLGAAGHARFRAEFTLERFAQHMSDIYEEVVL